MRDYVFLILIVLVYFSPVFYQLILVFKERKKGNYAPVKKLMRFVRYSLLIAIPFPIIFLVLNHTNYLDYEKPIRYEEYERITFENFRGLEFFKDSFYGSKRFAYVVTTIDYEITDNRVEVYSLFHPSRSFVYKKNISSDELLDHEKYHFKITELYARKARKSINELTYKDSNSIEKCIDEHWRQEREFQTQYDYDTFHSYVLSEQKKYMRYIDSSLNVLSAFKNPIIYLK